MKSLNHQFLFIITLAPEVQNGEKYSFPADIYSIGQVIYKMFENEFKNMKLDQKSEVNEYLKLYEIYENCIKKNPSERPQIVELIETFYLNYFSKVSISISEIEIIQNIKGMNSCYEYLFFVAENHHNVSQKSLGDIYSDGKICNKNIEKAIQYYLLATKEH